MPRKYGKGTEHPHWLGLSDEALRHERDAYVRRELAAPFNKGRRSYRKQRLLIEAEMARRGISD
jgi:hypothetical protein